MSARTAGAAVEDETVVISSSAPAPDAMPREFIPASARPLVQPPQQPSLGQIPLTPAERNVVRRFETLIRLL
ncbi:MAG: hypothetical protein RLN70_07550, partial [Rhodospirillaceae bacterium]